MLFHLAHEYDLQCQFQIYNIAVLCYKYELFSFKCYWLNVGNEGWINHCYIYCTLRHEKETCKQIEQIYN